MKIALFVHCFFPQHFYGTEAYTLAVAKELAALGHSPTVVTAKFPGEPASPELIERYNWEGIPVISIDKNKIPHLSIRETYDQPAMQPIHEALLRELAPDIVHVCHLINHTTALLAATRALGIPTVATLTDFFDFCYTNKLEAADGSLCAGPNRLRSNCIACHLKAAAGRPGPSNTARLLMDLRLIPTASRLLALLGQRRAQPIEIVQFRPADIVVRPDILRAAFGDCRVAVAPSQFLKQAFEQNNFPVPLVLSHFGVDIDRAAKPKPENPHQVRIGYIGQLAAHKGVHILLDALRAAQRDNLGLTIWGPHDQDETYYRMLQEKSRGLGVRFAGTFPPERLVEIMREIDVLAIPSTWYENSPLILLQALATHTPVIVSDVLGLTEFVTHGRNGFHFERGSLAALTTVLRQVADRKGWAQTAAEQTSYPRTSRDMVDDLLVVYKSAPNRSSAARGND